MSILIGFGYRARNGKDTAAQAIIDARGGDIDIRRYAFADELKVRVFDALQNPMDPFWDLYTSLTRQRIEFYTPIL